MPEFDFDKFRLRSFVSRLLEIDEVDIHEENVALADLSGIIARSQRASLFRNAGNEGYEIVGGVSGSRRRLAAAFDVEEPELVEAYARRMNCPQPVVEVPADEAPVRQVVYQGDEVDLMRLPFHLQHQYDGGPYISSGIDYSVDPISGRTNVGCRRMMLRNRREFGSNLTQPSDFRRNYIAAAQRGEPFPVSFAVGSHPLDFLAAGLRIPSDEYGLVATLRGEPLPMVRGLTNGVLAPADAEMIIEGHFDEKGFREKEGPYGEFWGLYGPVHINPVFHVTAITMRSDMLHQTVFHGDRNMAGVELATLSSVHSEAAVFKTLKAFHIVPAAVHSVTTVAPRQHIRVSLRNPLPGQARIVISALFGMVGVKHVVVVDDDIDVTSDSDVEWAMSTRFRADRDLVTSSGFPGYYADPTAFENQVSKIGFDATKGSDRRSIDTWRPSSPKVEGRRRFGSVREALQDGPKFFHQLLETTGSQDGRELVLELDGLRKVGELDRLQNGEWYLVTPDV